MVGLNPADRPYEDQAINDTFQRLLEPDTVVSDAIARPVIGPRPVGSRGMINGHMIKIVGQYSKGAGLIADGMFVVSDLTYAHLMGLPALDRAQFGLVRPTPGANVERVVADLRRSLPGDVQVWSRDELKRYEQHYFVHVKPIGLIFTSGLIIGLIVGGVIVFQVLSADIAKRKPQYATLRALGYSALYLNRVIVQQGLIFAVLGYVPALLWSFGLYALVRKLSNTPMYLTWFHASFVLLLMLLTSAISGLVAMRKIATADPADLY